MQPTEDASPAERDQAGADGSSPAREPVLNLPRALVAIIAVLLATHAVIELSPFAVLHAAIVHGAFIPARLTGDGGWEAVTMWLSYPFLHGSWGHVGLNAVWLAIFGTPVLRRVGVARFAALCAAGAIGAAALHAAAHWGDTRPMIGASGVVSALMGAAVRFAFQPAARLDPRLAPRLTLAGTLTSRAALPFIVVWMLANVLFGAGLMGPGGPSIAWEAHIGGFLVGLLGFAAFDQPRLVRERVAGSIDR